MEKVAEILPDKKRRHGWTRAQAYGYGSLANFLITLTSLIGILLIVFADHCKAGNQYLVDFFITLAASTMLGDAFFHILPRVLKIHVHSLTGDSHDDHDDD